MFESIREDWVAHDCTWTRHGFWAMVLYRFGRWRYTFGFRPVRVLLSFVYKLVKFFADPLLGIEIPCEATLGRRFTIEHTGAIVISGDAVFGDDCIVRQGVTVGLRNRNHRGSPRIGSRCDIGAGAKLLGDITIGDDVVIGANAVVLCDVPSGCLAVGVPAVVKMRRPRSVPVQVEAVGQR
jgi:serine O-acetyltransferase